MKQKDFWIWKTQQMIATFSEHKECCSIRHLSPFQKEHHIWDKSSMETFIWGYLKIVEKQICTLCSGYCCLSLKPYCTDDTDLFKNKTKHIFVFFLFPVSVIHLSWKWSMWKAFVCPYLTHDGRYWRIINPAILASGKWEIALVPMTCKAFQWICTAQVGCIPVHVEP